MPIRIFKEIEIIKLEELKKINSIEELVIKMKKNNITGLGNIVEELRKIKPIEIQERKEKIEYIEFVIKKVKQDKYN